VSSQDDQLKCAFCSKGASEVNKLIAANTASICDECVMLCVSIVAEGDAKRFDALIKQVRSKLPIKPR
jgi:ATP-dependent Clp protease ATP-binding subunit ClpX